MATKQAAIDHAVRVLLPRNLMSLRRFQGA